MLGGVLLFLTPALFSWLSPGPLAQALSRLTPSVGRIADPAKRLSPPARPGPIGPVPSVLFMNCPVIDFSEVRSLLEKRLRKTTLAPSKFIANPSACAFLAARSTRAMCNLRMVLRRAAN